MSAAAGNLSYATTGAPTTRPAWREPSIMAKIISISPVDYPLFTKTGNKKAKDIEHYWQLRTLPDRDFAAQTQLEGAQFDYEDTVEPGRPSNTCHIFWVGAEVSGSAQEIDYRGAAKLLADQVSYRSESHKGAIENGLWRSTQQAGATATARRMNGVVNSIASNVIDKGGVALTEEDFLNLAYQIWFRGPKARDAFTNGRVRKSIDIFSSEADTRWFDVSQTQVTHMVLLYQSSYGTISIDLSRDLLDGDATGELVMMDLSWFDKAWLRTTRMMPVSVDGDFLRTVVLSELTLEYGDERAAGKIINIAPPLTTPAAAPDPAP